MNADYEKLLNHISALELRVMELEGTVWTLEQIIDYAREVIRLYDKGVET